MKKKPLKAELYIGRVKKTENQRKKHISQMSKEEIAYLRNEIKLLPTWKLKLSKHVKKKYVQFRMEDVEATLLDLNVHNYIVEYNETYKKGVIDHRLVITSKKPRMVAFRTYGKQIVESWAKMSFVISLDTYELVTVYWNKVEDTHETRKMERYHENLRIIPSYKKAVS